MSGVHADGDTDSEIRKIRDQQHDSKLLRELRAANVDSDSENDQHEQHRREGDLKERLSDVQSRWSHGGGGSDDEQSVENVGPDDVSNGEVAMSLACRLYGGDQFRKRRSSDAMILTMRTAAEADLSPSSSSSLPSGVSEPEPLDHLTETHK